MAALCNAHTIARAALPNPMPLQYGKPLQGLNFYQPIKSTIMKVKIYKTRVIANVNCNDMDGCPSDKDEVIYENEFTSKVQAIRMAQRKFDKAQFNPEYVSHKWAHVIEFVITEKGRQKGRRIYNRFALI